MSSLTEMIYKVDEEGNFLGSDLRERLHRKGTAHRHAAVIGLVFDSKNRMLVQWRAKTKLGGNRLDVSATTHVRKGEDYLSALKRCLLHELGIRGRVQTRHLLDFKYEEDLGQNIEVEYCRVFKVSRSGEVLFNKAEIDYVEYVNLEELRARVKKDPSSATKWLRETLDRLKTAL